MLSFKVSVTTEEGVHHEYTELAFHSVDCTINAQDRFGKCKKIFVVRA